MKQLRNSLFALLLTLTLLLCGCGTQDAPDAPSEEQPDYAARVAELEAALQKQREEQYISENALKAEIRTLKQELAFLKGESTGTAVTPSDTLLFHYRLENGKAIITGVEGDSALLSVPATLDGYPVAGIGERAFEGMRIVAAVLPDGLEAVGWFAFYGCSALRDVTLPDSVRTIGYAAFDGCPDVTLVCSADSYAARFAESFGLAHIAP